MAGCQSYPRAKLGRSGRVTPSMETTASPTRRGFRLAGSAGTRVRVPHPGDQRAYDRAGRRVAEKRAEKVYSQGSPAAGIDDAVCDAEQCADNGGAERVPVPHAGRRTRAGACGSAAIVANFRLR